MYSACQDFSKPIRLPVADRKVQVQVHCVWAAAAALVAHSSALASTTSTRLFLRLPRQLPPPPSFSAHILQHLPVTLSPSLTLCFLHFFTAPTHCSASSVFARRRRSSNVIWEYDSPVTTRSLSIHRQRIAKPLPHNLSEHELADRPLETHTVAFLKLLQASWQAAARTTASQRLYPPRAILENPPLQRQRPAYL